MSERHTRTRVHSMSWKDLQQSYDGTHFDDLNLFSIEFKRTNIYSRQVRNVLTCSRHCIQMRRCMTEACGVCNTVACCPPNVKSGSIFRSEDMSLCQIIMPAEATFSCLAALGELGKVYFRDVWSACQLLPHGTTFSRQFFKVPPPVRLRRIHPIVRVCQLSVTKNFSVHNIKTVKGRQITQGH